MPHIEQNIIFFDGFCVLCSRTVALLIQLDKKRVLKYSALQGQYAQKLLTSFQREAGASVIFYSDGIFYEKAEAMIRIMIKLGGITKWLGFFINLLPLFILNKIYDFVARHRYYFFGKNDVCTAPTSKERELFVP